MSSVDIATPPTESVSPRRWTWREIMLLIVLLAVAGVVRVAWIDRYPSFDELWHLGITKGFGSPLSYYAYDVVHLSGMRQTSLEGARPVWTLWTDMPGVLHPPLYMIALRLWREVAGDSVLASHLFSILCSLIALSFLFATARLAMNRSAAALVTLAFGCAQTQVYLAQEIRSYALLNLFGAMAIWLMTRVVVLGATLRRAVLLAAITLPLVMTHYFSFGAAVAIGLFGLLRLGVHRRVFIVAVSSCAAFFITAWMPFAIRQSRHFQVGDVLLKSDRDLVFETLMVAGAPFRLFAERDYQIELTPVLSGVLFILPWLLVRRFRPLLPWALWLCCSLGCIVALDLFRSTRHVAYVRYLAVASPAVPLLFVGVVWPLRQRWLVYLVSLTLLLGGLAYLISGNRVILDAQDYNALTRIIEPRIAPDDAILVHDVQPGTDWRPPVWIMTLSDSPRVFPRTFAMLTCPPSQSLLKQLGTDIVWLVVPASVLPGDLLPTGRVLETYAAPEAIVVYRIKLESVGPASIPATGIAR